MLYVNMNVDPNMPRTLWILEKEINSFFYFQGIFFLILSKRTHLSDAISDRYNGIMMNTPLPMNPFMARATYK